MKYSHNEIKVGFVVFSATALFVTFVLLLSGSGLWQDSVNYTAEFSMSAGLQPGDLVRYGGMKVGHILTVSIAPEHPDKIQIAFEVEATTPVKSDSVVFINYIGLLGAYYLEISAGSAESLPLPGGSLIASRDLLQFSDMMARVDSISGIIEDLFVTIDEKVALILTNAEDTMLNVNQLLGAVNREKVTSILDNIDRIVTTNVETISGILKNLESMLSQVDARRDGGAFEITLPQLLIMLFALGWGSVFAGNIQITDLMHRGFVEIHAVAAADVENQPLLVGVAVAEKTRNQRQNIKLRLYAGDVNRLGFALHMIFLKAHKGFHMVLFAADGFHPLRPLHHVGVAVVAEDIRAVGLRQGQADNAQEGVGHVFVVDEETVQQRLDAASAQLPLQTLKHARGMAEVAGHGDGVAEQIGIVRVGGDVYAVGWVFARIHGKHRAEQAVEAAVVDECVLVGCGHDCFAPKRPSEK